jgi:hypothetical protein
MQKLSFSRDNDQYLDQKWKSRGCSIFSINDHVLKGFERHIVIEIYAFSSSCYRSTFDYIFDRHMVDEIDIILRNS